MAHSSLRYGGGVNDLRTGFLKLCGRLQKKEVVIVNADPKKVSEILLASDTKGTFIEHLIATPAWRPILSTESVDGPVWEELSEKFKIIMARLRWRERLSPICERHTKDLQRKMEEFPDAQINAEEISLLSLRILFELLFETQISKEDEAIFYRASLEWRKEIAMKGQGNPIGKKAFWDRLLEIVQQSRFKDDLAFDSNPEFWLSAFAQPFLISPQINISDIMVATFHFLRLDPSALTQAQRWASEGDKAKLGAILLEAIRLKHPFPILEREVRAGSRIGGIALQAKTQFFVLLDQFQQDSAFKPERWLPGAPENPYHALPFGAGPRMCIGKPIAMEILTHVLKVFLTDYPLEKIQPQQGHLYSGRNNDKNAGFKETVYQLKTVLKGLWRSWRLGHQAEKVTQVPTCPWKKTMQFLGSR